MVCMIWAAVGLLGTSGSVTIGWRLGRGSQMGVQSGHNRRLNQPNCLLHDPIEQSTRLFGPIIAIAMFVGAIDMERALDCSKLLECLLLLRGHQCRSGDEAGNR